MNDSDNRLPLDKTTSIASSALNNNDEYEPSKNQQKPEKNTMATSTKTTGNYLIYPYIYVNVFEMVFFIIS